MKWHIWFSILLWIWTCSWTYPLAIGPWVAQSLILILVPKPQTLDPFGPPILVRKLDQVHSANLVLMFWSLENIWRRKIFWGGGEEKRKEKRRKIFGEGKYIFWGGKEKLRRKRGKIFGEGKEGKYLGKFWSAEDSSLRGKIMEKDKDMENQ